MGSRTIEQAEWLAHRHNIPTAHGTYKELCNDPNVDIVYIASSSLHPNHNQKDHAVMALNCGKHVLVEKVLMAPHLKTSKSKYREAEWEMLEEK